ncbi:unnamed protein product [Trypanosoma congolense IL3000]|uniref:WGS project CAEQ00000000 data, annotated contig 1177 n=1 Tax=Trypanosoma congolense (strain IL3000) TaxID=1068625 RepID=F9W4F7_TRYCI|nr:unnamed protein product [Trypanosoma congolense IL3000]
MVAVRVNNKLSEDIELTCRVPHGSVLGLLLFIIITVNSLSEGLNRIPGLLYGFFAYDLTIMCTNSNSELIGQALQRELDCIGRWLEKHYMKMSAEKSEYAFFGARNRDPLELRPGDMRLRETRAVRLLETFWVAPSYAHRSSGPAKTHLVLRGA